MIEIIPRIAARLNLSSRLSRFTVLGAFPRKGVGAEIGVHMGDYAARILAIVRPRKLHLIDPWLYFGDETYKESIYGGPQSNTDEMERRFRSVKERFSKRIATGQVNIIRKPSAEAMEEIDDEALDFVYIDGNHRYEFVKQDLELSLSKVKSGGIIAGDDYTEGGWWKGGVKKAVDEFGWKENVSLLWIVGGQFVLRKK